MHRTLESENASEAKSYLMRPIIHGETNATGLTFGGFKDLFIQGCLEQLVTKLIFY